MHRFIDTLWTCAARTAAVTRVPPPPTQCVGGVYYKDAVHDNLSALLYQIRIVDGKCPVITITTPQLIYYRKFTYLVYVVYNDSPSHITATNAIGRHI